MDNTNNLDSVSPQTPNGETDSRVTAVAEQPIPFNRLLVVAISATLIFMLGGAFGAVTLFVGVLAKQGLPSQPVTALNPQTAEVIVVVQTATPAASQAVVTQPDQSAQPEQLPVADAKTVVAGAREYSRLGNKAAPVEIVVFSDPQCPYCKKNALGTEQQVIDQYVKTGKASFVYRHYTFLGTESTQIAIAMECAGEQGKFWEFHKQAFENQQPENAGLVDQALMLSWAKSTQLDASKFTTCLSDPEMKSRVQQDTDLGGKLGVRGTPTLFINGRPLPGAMPFDFLQSTIESDLAEAK